MRDDLEHAQHHLRQPQPDHVGEEHRDQVERIGEKHVAYPALVGVEGVAVGDSLVPEQRDVRHRGEASRPGVFLALVDEHRHEAAHEDDLGLAQDVGAEEEKERESDEQDCAEVIPAVTTEVDHMSHLLNRGNTPLSGRLDCN